jgi:hypothetical protein
LIMQTLDDEAVHFRPCEFHFDAFRSDEISMGARLPAQPILEFTKRC